MVNGLSGLKTAVISGCMCVGLCVCVCCVCVIVAAQDGEWPVWTEDRCYQWLYVCRFVCVVCVCACVFVCVCMYVCVCDRCGAGW